MTGHFSYLSNARGSYFSILDAGADSNRGTRNMLCEARYSEASCHHQQGRSTLAAFIESALYPLGVGGVGKDSIYTRFSLPLEQLGEDLRQ